MHIYTLNLACYVSLNLLDKGPQKPPESPASPLRHHQCLVTKELVQIPIPCTATKISFFHGRMAEKQRKNEWP